MVYSVATQKQFSNPAPISSSTNGFCVDLSPTVAASLRDRPSHIPAPGSAAVFGKPVLFAPSRSSTLDEIIKEKFKNVHNSSVLLNGTKARGIGKYDPNRQEDAQEFLTSMLASMENIQNCRSLQEILSNHKCPETIGNYKCPKCSVTAEAVRKYALIRAPPVLIVHLLRFEDLHKMDAYIRFPLSFDLRPYMSSGSSNAVNYKLFAIINHRGLDTKSGHYVACTNRRGVWFEHNDATVTQITSKRVLEQKPYLLFYKLLNPEEALCIPIAANGTKEDSGPSSKPDSLDPTIFSNISSSQIQQKLGVIVRSPSHTDSEHSIKQESTVSSVSILQKLDENVNSIPATVTPSGLIQKISHDKLGKNYLALKRPYPNSSSCPVPFKIRRNDTNFESRHHRHWHNKFNGRRHRHHRHYRHGGHWYNAY
ncbi:hypothetical protein Aperf_G00000109859 [Anoplocephala perfoliata]